jgi:Flp pilus assembly protein TadG
MKRNTPNLHSQRGVAIIEFALILPLLLVLAFATTELGRALYEYQTVAKSVRQAARYLSMQNPNTQQAQAANLIVYGYTAPPSNAQPLARGLSTSNVIPPVWQNQGSAPAISTVTVGVTNYQFQSIFTTAFGVDFGTVTFSDIRATMRSHS